MLEEGDQALGEGLARVVLGVGRGLGGRVVGVAGILDAVDHVDELDLVDVGVVGVDEGVQLVARAELLVDGLLDLVEDLPVHAGHGVAQLVEAVGEGAGAGVGGLRAGGQGGKAGAQLVFV